MGNWDCNPTYRSYNPTLQVNFCSFFVYYSINWQLWSDEQSDNLGCWKSRFFFWNFYFDGRHQILWSFGIILSNEVMPLTLDLRARRGSLSNSVDRRKRRGISGKTPRKLTCPQKGTISKGNFIFQPLTFWGYVSFRGTTAWNRNSFCSLRKGSHHGDELLSSACSVPIHVCRFRYSFDWF